MTFDKFIDVVNAERNKSQKVGFSFMIHLSAIKPNIHYVLKDSYLDQAENDYINPLVLRMVELIWNDY
jgi:hypothetical protein